MKASTIVTLGIVGVGAYLLYTQLPNFNKAVEGAAQGAYDASLGTVFGIPSRGGSIGTPGLLRSGQDTLTGAINNLLPVGSMLNPLGIGGNLPGKTPVSVPARTFAQTFPTIPNTFTVASGATFTNPFGTAYAGKPAAPITQAQAIRDAVAKATANAALGNRIVLGR